MDNENLTNLPSDQNGQTPEIEYPVCYNLKVVLDTNETTEIQQRNIELVLEDVEVEYEFVSTKQSSKGSFVSYTINVTLQNKEQMEKLYTRLKLLPGIKFAV
jgi:putative lipoic acid-binding regulatory protein